VERDFAIGAAADLAEGQRKIAFIDGRSVVVFNIAGNLHAVENSCPHNGASIANGRLEGTMLTCPAHGLRFDVVTGCMPGAAGLCLTTLAVKVVEEQLVVTADVA
jgi:3-phenylpropionate/trans-cinnamate dioxygenase ferredoxin component